MAKPEAVEKLYVDLLRDAGYRTGFAGKWHAKMPKGWKAQENTIIVYTADNGYHMGNRGFAGKWSHYEESLRVPMVVFDPRVREKAKGQVREEAVLNLDLPSTFLSWAGVEVPKRYQGKTFHKLITDSKPTPWRTHTFHEHFAVRHRIPAFEGMRSNRYKYVRYVDQGNYEFLHNLRKDPKELVNLAGDPKHAKKLQEMRELTNRRVEELGGPLAEKTTPLSLSIEPHPKAAATVANRPGSDGFSNLIASGNRIRNWSGDPKYWTKKDGVLIGTTDGSLKMNRFITWKVATVRNFDLRVKVRVSAGGNSGIQYRGTSRPDLGLDVVTGYQCDVVADKPEYNGMLYEEKGRRILSHTGEKVVIDANGQPWITANFEVKPFKPGQWHEYRIRVEANHHRHWIDGHPTADLIDLDEKGRLMEGVLAMQVHKGPAMTIEFKDMRIKHLPDDLPIQSAAEHPIPPGSKGVRPQGKLPKGWKAPEFSR